MLEKGELAAEGSWGLFARGFPLAGELAAVGLRRGISVSMEEDATRPRLGLVLAAAFLDGFLGGGSGKSLAVAGENLLGDSGDEAGEAGEVNVVTAGARDSPF